MSRLADDGLRIFFTILVTLFIPTLGVLSVAGCGLDAAINFLLVLLGYIPGHLHAFYLEYVYFKRRGEARTGKFRSQSPPPAFGVFSARVLHGGSEYLLDPHNRYNTNDNVYQAHHTEMSTQSHPNIPGPSVDPSTSVTYSQQV